MKIKLDNELLIEISDIQKSIIKYDIKTSEFEQDIIRRIKWVIEHKIDQCQDRMIKEWKTKLESRYSSLPTNKDELCKMIIAQSDYLDREGKDANI